MLVIVSKAFDIENGFKNFSSSYIYIYMYIYTDTHI